MPRTRRNGQHLQVYLPCFTYRIWWYINLKKLARVEPSTKIFSIPNAAHHFYTSTTVLSPGMHTTTNTMRAAVRMNGDNEFVIKDVPKPTPGPNQVLLKIEAAGVCHSDTFLLSDDIPDDRAYIGGHENVGVVIK